MPIYFVPLLAAGLALMTAPGGDLEELSWLTGSWASKQGGLEIEEHWLPPKGGLMLGLNRTVSAKGRAFFEYLRIVASPEGVSYLASPGGQNTTEFRMTESGPDWVIFENPDHDFPQKITYRLKGDRLVAEIGGNRQGEWKSQRFEWTRQ